jgi:hypothetical protein
MRAGDPSVPIRPHFRRGVSSERRSRHQGGVLLQSMVFIMSLTNLHRIDALLALQGDDGSPVRAVAPVD